MKKKKGFTLIELLAVIVILAVIALIATPAIINVIENARKKAFENTSYGVLESLRLDYVERVMSENSNEDKEFDFSNTNVGLKLSGEIPKYGKAKIDNKGNISIVLADKDKKWCAKKDGASEKVIITDYFGNECKTESLKKLIEEDETHIAKNVKVNGEIVNKVIGKKEEKLAMKNYVWHMGNLWQVLETNDNNNTIKLITAHSLTSIAYGETSDYNTSWVKKWLNEVFYASLEGTDLVRDTNFCLDKVETSSETIIDDNNKILKVNSHTQIDSCQNKINEKVGLMSFEDYVYSNNGETPIYKGGSYLDEDEMEWTLTAYNNTHNWIQWYKNPASITNNDNSGYSEVKGFGLGVRPVISIDSSAVVKEGAGTKSNPYVLLNERKANSGSKINSIKVGDYVYLDESNNPNTFTEEYVARDLKYTTTKDKVRYRVVKKNTDGTVKVQRADVLRSLPNTVAMNSGMYVPYYYNASADGCYYNSSEEKWYTLGCMNNNIFKITGITDEYNYQNSINIGDYLNSSSNSFYNWYSYNTNNMIEETEYGRFTGGHAKDYSNLNSNPSGTYPSKTDDEKVTAKVVLPTWGEMYSGNDLNISYWYINRWNGSSSLVSRVDADGIAYGYYAAYPWNGARPVVTLKTNVKIKSGEGTMTKPYSLSYD